MLAKVMSCAIVGLEAQLVEVEVDITGGQPFFTLVGLPALVNVSAIHTGGTSSPAVGM